MLNGQEHLSTVGVFLDDGLELPLNVISHGPGQQGHPPLGHLRGLLHKGHCHLVEQARVQRVLDKGSRKEFVNGLSLQVQMCGDTHTYVWRYTDIVWSYTNTYVWRYTHTRMYGGTQSMELHKHMYGDTRTHVW